MLILSHVKSSLCCQLLKPFFLCKPKCSPNLMYAGADTKTYGVGQDCKYCQEKINGQQETVAIQTSITDKGKPTFVYYHKWCNQDPSWLCVLLNYDALRVSVMIVHAEPWCVASQRLNTCSWLQRWCLACTKNAGCMASMKRNLQAFAFWAHGLEPLETLSQMNPWTNKYEINDVHHPGQSGTPKPFEQQSHSSPLLCKNLWYTNHTVHRHLRSLDATAISWNVQCESSEAESTWCCFLLLFQILITNHCLVTSYCVGLLQALCPSASCIQVTTDRLARTQIWACLLHKLWPCGLD